jgi:ubiquinone/menaquinone biosynthesis C-methylase UbiE
LQFLKPSSNILELNCGTGEDAIFFANKGHNILATDLSEGMLTQLKSKIRNGAYDNKISTAQCSFTTLDQLPAFEADHIFSNFGGLNCTGELAESLRQMDALLKPGGKITLVIISKFCLWETLLLFKGKFKTAFRRFNSSKGRIANVEGTNFKCWYYNSAYIKTHLNNYTVLAEEGLCTLVPPSYIENFAQSIQSFTVFLKEKKIN